MSSVITVATEAQFTAAIAQVAAASSGSTFTIALTGDIVLASPPPGIVVPDGVALTIDGQGHGLRGAGTQPGLDAASGALTLADLSINETSTSGTGGGLLVGGLADVTLDQVSFTGDQASAGQSGMAEGGAVFVVAGGSLIFNSGSIAGSMLSGGASQAGAGIFMQGAESISFAPGAGQTVTVGDAISDQAGSGGTGLDAGVGSIAKSGDGTLVLAAADTFTGDVTVTDGTLDLENSAAAGLGAVVLAGAGAVLKIGRGVVLPNQVSGFSVGCVIDLAGVGTISQATIGADDVLTAGGVTLQLTGDEAGAVVETRSDQDGGTDLILQPPPPTLQDTSSGGLADQPELSGNAPAGSTVTLFAGGAAIGTVQVGNSGLWSITPDAPLDDGLHELTASFVDASGAVSAAAPTLLVDVTLGQGYDVRAARADGTTEMRHFDPSGALAWVDIADARGLIMQSVDATQAVRTVYDLAGAAVGSIAEASGSPIDQPASSVGIEGSIVYFSTGTAGSTVTLLGDQAVLTTHGADHVSAAGGNDSIFAGGTDAVSVTGGNASLLFVGNDAAATVTGASGGGTGSATLYGGLGGGWLEGGSDGRNVLIASGGNTTLVGGGAGDLLVAGAGPAEILARGGDTAFGGAGGSTIYGAAGAVLVGGSAATDFICGSGPESCYGGTADDVFFAGTGQALIDEGNGRDFVAFGAGATTVTGGTGLDRYDFTSGQAGGDATIAGFKNGTDQIDLHGYAAGSVRSTVDGGNLVIALEDGTRITLLGVSALAAGSIGL